MNSKDLFRKKTIDSILQSGIDSANTSTLKRNLTVRDLTSFGIAAIIGAGIFSTIGNSAFHGGPAVSVLFLITAVACGFSALCYAEFASAIPISGSAYTYAYASFGELIAWIIGWDLIMEYAVGNIAVAISWSDYFTLLLKGIGISFPDFLAMDHRTAHIGFLSYNDLISKGVELSNIPANIINQANTWNMAPTFFGIHIIFDLPAILIVFFVTWLVYKGIYESKVTSNILVLIKLAVLMLVIGVGAFYVNPGNWHPFAPNGFTGVLKGISGVFFAYIGFDAISTTSEECKNPQRDIPRAMILALVITTVIYILISLVLTGMVNYKELGVADPLAYVFQKLHLHWFSGIIALSAVFAMTGVLLVFQVGQPRIWMSMGRDGLLPQKFAQIHKKHKTPSFATIITGLFVGLPLFFVTFEEVIDLTSIGTLFAFILVSGGVLLLDKKDLNKQNIYKIPFIGSRYIILPLWFLIIFIVYLFNEGFFKSLFNFNLPFGEFKHKIPFLVFTLAAFIITVLCIIKNLSLIPVISLLANAYLMTGLGITNWLRFIIWLVIGLVFYFSFGIKRSKLNIADSC